MRKAIAAVIIENKKILLVRKKDTWIFPGGKPIGEESNTECLCRKVSEELSGAKLENLRLYGEFRGITPHKKDDLELRVYFADIKGECRAPSAEINAAEFVEDTSNYNLSDITSRVIIALKEDRYI